LVTLTLTSDDLESYIVMNVSSTLTLTNTTVCFVAALFHCGRTYGRTDVHTDGRTFLPGLLGHLPKMSYVQSMGYGSRGKYLI